jgi:hypothetical protein
LSKVLETPESVSKMHGPACAPHGIAHIAKSAKSGA